MKHREHWLSHLREWFVKKQNNRCAICGVHFEIARRTHLDHCHVTKHTRGALCSSCNSGLGMFKEDVALLESAISYLQVDYSQNPPHPKDELGFNPTIGLAPREFDYAAWFRYQQVSERV